MVTIRFELSNCQTELVRRRHEAKKHEEEMEVIDLSLSLVKRAAWRILCVGQHKVVRLQLF